MPEQLVSKPLADMVEIKLQEGFVDSAREIAAAVMSIGKGFEDFGVAAKGFSEGFGVAAKGFGEGFGAAGKGFGAAALVAAGKFGSASKILAAGSAVTMVIIAVGYSVRYIPFSIHCRT
jgi:hypothetical protein